MSAERDVLTGLDVLLVEDEVMIAVDAQGILEALGARSVRLACTFNHAASYIAEAAFDVAVLDVNINGLMSFPLGAQLCDKRIPFIFATGYNLGDSTLAGLDTRICILKPYDEQRMREGLQRALHPAANVGK